MLLKQFYWLIFSGNSSWWIFLIALFSQPFILKTVFSSQVVSQVNANSGQKLVPRWGSGYECVQTAKWMHLKNHKLFIGWKSPMQIINNIVNIILNCLYSNIFSWTELSVTSHIQRCTEESDLNVSSIYPVCFNNCIFCAHSWLDQTEFLSAPCLKTIICTQK